MISASQANIQQQAIESDIDENTRLLPETCRNPSPEETASDDDIESASQAIEQDVPEASVRTIISVLLVGVFIAQADSSIVLATSQQIASEFNLLSDASWLITTYVLAQAASQPLYGKLSDIFGRKTNLVFAYTIFTVGCLLCGASPSYWQVLAGRAVSGIGGADLLPVREIATWRSYVNVIATLGRSCGGPVGGWLAGSIGWRWCFLAQCPLAGLTGLLVLFCLPQMHSRHDENQQPVTKEDFKGKVARVDWIGACMLPTMLIALFLSLNYVGNLYPWYYSAPTGTFALMMAFAFYYVEEYVAKEPILPFRLLAKRDVFTTYAIVSLQTGAQFVIVYTIPIYFQIVTGMSVASAGSRIVLVVAGNTVGGLLSGYMIRRTNHYKRFMVLGMLLACISYILILVRWRGHTNWAETLYVVLSGLGTGTIQSTTFVHLAASLDSKDIAIGGTSWFLSQNFGVLVAANLFDLVHHSSLNRALNSDLADTPNKSEIIEKAISSIQYIWTLPARLRSIVIQSYVHSLFITNGLALCLGVTATLWVFSVREHILHKK